MFQRYVAVGDSQTEGLYDIGPGGALRGWADRLAERLAEVRPDLRYANLAVRGRLASQVRAEQVPAALVLRPDLVTVCAGMNDLLRPRADVARVAADLDAMFGELTYAGAHVVAMTYPDIGRIMPVARYLVPRVIALNAGIRRAARRWGATLVDAFPHPAVADQRLYCVDRLHANAEGHARFAAAVAHALGVPGSDDGWTTPLPPLPPRSRWQHAGTELKWLATFVAPWLGRNLLGRTSGARPVAKRPALTPVVPART
ncbi:SGNH/GDSL hydrolase family protein [Saccharopolyspora taberi]|uniref:SGNH/GDSL hydrolase family protein n=1 Tax=Saccharopolyspora taberi TaxID=60895 RepID=A0ABN3VEL4_9PSEU